MRSARRSSKTADSGSHSQRRAGNAACAKQRIHRRDDGGIAERVERNQGGYSRQRHQAVRDGAQEIQGRSIGDCERPASALSRFDVIAPPTGTYCSSKRMHHGSECLDRELSGFQPTLALVQSMEAKNDRWQRSYPKFSATSPNSFDDAVKRVASMRASKTVRNIKSALG